MEWQYTSRIVKIILSNVNHVTSKGGEIYLWQPKKKETKKFYFVVCACALVKIPLFPKNTTVSQILRLRLSWYCHGGGAPPPLPLPLPPPEQIYFTPLLLNLMTRNRAGCVCKREGIFTSFRLTM